MTGVQDGLATVNFGEGGLTVLAKSEVQVVNEKFSFSGARGG